MIRTSLSRRLLLSGFLLCTFIVMGVTAIELNMHRLQQKEQVREEFSHFEKGTKQAISEAVWLYDWSMVKTIVESQTSQLISFIEICDSNAAKCIQHGVENDGPFLAYTSSILHQVNSAGESRKIGLVRLQGHYDRFSHHVATDGLSFLFTNAVSVYGIALLIFLLFHRQLIRRLVEVEKYTRRIDLSHVEEVAPLTYQRGERTPDEVDMLADAIGGLVGKIQDEFERRRSLELQLTQAQKMEALGTLAGGIAHDFKPPPQNLWVGGCEN